MIKPLGLTGLIVAISTAAAAMSSPGAATVPPKCAAIDVPRHIISDHGGRWVELAPAQWQFLRGVYAADPTTPVSLPVGDRAALAEVAGADFGLVFFIDGDRACTPMVVSHDVMDMLRDIGVGQIKHVGAGL